MSGTDPGLGPGDTNATADNELDQDEAALASKLLGRKVGRIQMHPIEQRESEGFSAAVYKGDAHAPPRSRSADYSTQPDAKVLLDITQPLAEPPLGASAIERTNTTQPLAVPPLVAAQAAHRPAEPPERSTAEAEEKSRREAPTDPGERPAFATTKRSEGEERLDAPQSTSGPRRSIVVLVAATLAVVAALVAVLVNRFGSAPVVPGAAASDTSAALSSPSAAMPSAPMVAPSTIMSVAPVAPSAPVAASSSPVVVESPRPPRQPASTLRAQPSASAPIVPPRPRDPDLPPIKNLDED